MSSNIVALENVRLVFKNFRGEAKQYNNAGDRNFNVEVSDSQADMLQNLGYRVRTLVSSNPDIPPRNVMLVKVSYKFSAPKVLMMSGRAKQLLDEDTIGELDFADIQSADLTIKPSHWTMRDGTSGITAYLNSLYVTLVDDPFADKYADEPVAEEDPF